jgi:urease accessory protein
MADVLTAGPAAAQLELLLADGRFPGGGFAHSGGLEAAVAEGSVRDPATLAEFLNGRLHHCLELEAWLAARASDHPFDAAVLVRLEAEADAHQPSVALRAASRVQGRGLRRTAAIVFPAVGPLPVEVHAVVLGAVAGRIGVEPAGAARLALHGAVLTVASAAAKLAALDMADALAAVAAIAPAIGAVAARAGAAPSIRPRSAPLTELRAELHHAWEVRLFAS